MLSSETLAVPQVPFTAFVVTFNERRHLHECLDSVACCDQLIVVDLGSTDGSLEIAANSGAEIILRKRVPIVEQVRMEGVIHARNDWIIFLDPDEVFPTASIPDLVSTIATTPTLGIIRLPWQFYFKSKPLRCTIWGTNNEKAAVVHKHRIAFSSAVHRGFSLVKGYTVFAFPRENRYTIKHYWVNSYEELITKHLRYLRNEGYARSHHGERFSFNRLIREPIAALKDNLIQYHGLQGGGLGIFLSFFYAYYIFSSLYALRKYEKQYLNKS